MKCDVGKWSGEGGFSLVELLISGGVVTLLVVTFAVFIQATGVSIANVTSQASFNQAGGHVAEVIIRRARLANTATNSADGNQLTLSFDDDPERDSSGDGVAWNDLDHFERFAFVTPDGDETTLEDNQLTYDEMVGTSPATALISGGVRRLTGLSVFTVTNSATVLVNFGLLSTNESVHSQGIEVRTQVRLRNKMD